MSQLSKQILDDLKKALKNRDEKKISVLRDISSQIKNLEIEKNKREAGLSDDEVLNILTRLAKQRKDSIQQYIEGGREDLAQKEKKELTILKEYIPEPLSEKELEEIIDKAIEKTKAQTIKDMGKVMGIIMSENKGKVDGNQVKKLILKRLQK